MKYKVNIRCIQGPNNNNKWRWTFSETTTVVLGRISGCHLRLKDKKISQSHCLLQIQNSRLYAVDMGSAHGSMVNGHQVEQGYPLKDGDVLTLGDTRLLLQITAMDLPPLPLVTADLAPEICQEATFPVGERLQTRSRPVGVIAEKTRDLQMAEKSDRSRLRCSFCGTEKKAINRLRACSFCPSCEQIAQFFAKTLPEYRVEGFYWRIFAYAVVVIVVGKGKRKLLYISKVSMAEISLRLGDEIAEVEKNGHPNLYPILAKHEHKERFLAFLPYCPGVFANQLEKLPPVKAIDIISTIGKALEYGTRYWGPHGEICPANIYLEITGTPYLFGYGVLRQAHLSHSKATPGELEPAVADFCAPERLQQPSAPTLASDIFSLAASLFALITKETPQKNALQKTKNASFFPENEYFRQPLLVSFFQKALAYDPAIRYPNIPHFLDALAMIRCLYD